jgi:hypothetical protein
MAQANVYTTVSDQTWYTDKCRISTGATAVTYNVNLIYPSAAGNLFSAASQIPPQSLQDVYVGVGNKITISGSNYTAQEIGTRSSGQLGVQSANNAVILR